MNRLHRVLIEIIDVGHEVILVRVDAWNPDETITLSRQLVRHLEPMNDRDFMFAKANVGAINKSDLIFTEFEPAPNVRSEPVSPSTGFQLGLGADPDLVFDVAEIIVENPILLQTATEIVADVAEEVGSVVIDALSSLFD